MKYRRILAAMLSVFLLVSLAACGSENPEATLPQGKEVALGQLQERTYTNAYAGFSVTLPEGWEFLVAEEKQELPEQLTDLNADNSAELVSLVVKYQKHSRENMAGFAAMTQEQVVDSVLKGKDQLSDAYQKEGMVVANMEKVKVQFAGSEHYAVRTESTIQNVPYFTTTIYFFGQGLYGVTLTAGSFMTDKTAQLLEMFTEV